jgi:23S rRNA (adenine2503-C2)-methyltransferase
MPDRRANLYDLTREELRLRFVRWGFSPVHAARLWNYLYLALADSFDTMLELPAKVRDRLAAETRLGTLPTALATDSADGFTRKYLLALPDGERIETVLMRFTGRVTACVSSQVGCAMGCVFCATGQMGYTRHLTPGEIVAQAVHVARQLRDVAGVADPGQKPEPGSATPATTSPRLRNVVLMGMGEPLHNYDAVIQAVDILRDSSGLALGAERITLEHGGRRAGHPAPGGGATSAPPRGLAARRHPGGARRARARRQKVAARRAHGGLPHLLRDDRPPHLLRVDAHRGAK